MTHALNTAVLWTGGKDSCLAMHRVRQAGRDIACLVTFAPAGPRFLAHPLEIIQLQAKALGLPHLLIQIDEPYRESYQTAIAKLRDGRNITTLVTGDIDLVAGLPNWIGECCDGLGVRVEMPLWHAPRRTLMDELISTGHRAVLSLVKPPFTREWVGRAIDRDCLESLEKLHAQAGVDICGENGEYHSLVLDGPAFAGRIELDWQAESREEFFRMDIRDAKLLAK